MFDQECICWLLRVDYSKSINICTLYSGHFKNEQSSSKTQEFLRGRALIFTGCLQEMDEHMRSMLHHRELEKLKGR